MRRFVPLLALLLAAPAAAQETGCMERHLREALHLNRARAPLYAAETGGRSRPISRALIWSERAALPAARYLDWRAAEWQRAGIPVVCGDFEPMDRTPAFVVREPDPPPLSAFAPTDARGMRRSVARAYRTGGFPAAGAVLEAEVARLSAIPAFHCMTRHLLESALRVSNGAPRYEEEARARGLSSPAELSRTLLDLHLAALGEAARLDRRAAPLQAEGVPIVCRDVPPIPPHAAGSEPPHDPAPG